MSGEFHPALANRITSVYHLTADRNVSSTKTAEAIWLVLTKSAEILVRGPAEPKLDATLSIIYRLVHASKDLREIRFLAAILLQNVSE